MVHIAKTVMFLEESLAGIVRNECIWGFLKIFKNVDRN